MMKRALSLVLFLAVLFTAGCKETDEQTSLPRGEISPQWAAAAESFYNDAMSVTAPDRAQPYSIMAVEHGKVVFEQWYNGKTPESTFDVYSVSKTVLALAVGFAVEEGLFSVEDRVADYFLEQLPEHVSDTLSAMTIRHLLTMTCGLEESPKLLSVFNKNAHDIQVGGATAITYGRANTAHSVWKVLGPTRIHESEKGGGPRCHRQLQYGPEVL